MKVVWPKFAKIKELEVSQSFIKKVMKVSGMAVPERISRVKASGLTSFYKKKNKIPIQRFDVKVFKDGAKITPDMFEALKRLNKLVKDCGGNFFIIDLFRSWDTQEEARRKFERREKKAFVAKPGGSFHNAGRAVDISVHELNFQGLKKKDWLKTLWDFAKPLGFKPVIEFPDIDASEAWHFDFPGEDWEKAYESLPYSRVAKCAILDIGCWDSKINKEKVRRMFIQSQLIRLGYHEIGKVDGIFGPKTKKVLRLEGYEGMSLLKVCNLIAKRSL